MNGSCPSDHVGGGPASRWEGVIPGLPGQHPRAGQESEAPTDGACRVPRCLQASPGVGVGCPAMQPPEPLGRALGPAAALHILSS